jgi:hypothetical protein
MVRKPRKLRQPIADSMPWSFGPDEDVKGWTNARIIDEDTQADMSEFAIAHDRNSCAPASRRLDFARYRVDYRRPRFVTFGLNQPKHRPGSQDED